MSEIEKLYENAGIEKTKGDCLFCPLDVHTCVRSYDECPYYYPLFTAEKQIELIKMLSINYVDKPNKTLWINKDEIANEWFISVHYSDHYGYSNHADNFEEALAGLINQLWQDLTEEEKQQVKEISG